MSVKMFLLKKLQGAEDWWRRGGGGEQGEVVALELLEEEQVVLGEPPGHEETEVADVEEDKLRPVMGESRGHCASLQHSVLPTSRPPSRAKTEGGVPRASSPPGPPSWVGVVRALLRQQDQPVQSLGELELLEEGLAGEEGSFLGLRLRFLSETEELEEVREGPENQGEREGAFWKVSL